jgi:hypothetical protein
MPSSYQSSGHEVLIVFSVVLSSVSKASITLKLKNQYIKDVTLNKSIEVLERQISSCMYCFRINVTKALVPKNGSSSVFTETNTPLLALGTAGAATLLAGKIINCTNVFYYQLFNWQIILSIVVMYAF